MSLMIGLTADNSSGVQRLHFNTSEEGLGICLTGDYKGSRMQVDFKPLDVDEVEMLIRVLSMYKERL